MRTFPLLALLLALATSSCKKDNDPSATLPPATHEGRNTGGCLINGEPFVATGVPSGGILGPAAIPSLTGGFHEDSLYYLTMYGKYNNQDVDVTLFLRSQAPGTYNLNTNTPTFLMGGLSRRTLAHATFTYSNNGGETYVTTAQHTGKVNLTHADLTTGISAGTFEFTAVSSLDPTKTLKVTNGRFDIKQ